MIQAQQPKLLLDNIMVRFLTDIAYRNVEYKYPTYTLIYTIKEQIIDILPLLEQGDSYCGIRCSVYTTSVGFCC